MNRTKLNEKSSSYQLADSHAASILSSLSNTSKASPTTLANKLMSNFSAVAFSKPIAQSLNFNAFLNNKNTDATTQTDSSNTARKYVTNRLIDLPNTKNSYTFNLTQSLTDNSFVPPRPIKQQSTARCSSKMSKSNEKKTYRASLKTLKADAQTNAIISSNLAKSVLNDYNSQSSRAITFKLFAANDFKMNLPPINQYKLYNSFDKKLGAKRTSVIVTSSEALVLSGESDLNRRRLKKSSSEAVTSSNVSRVSNTRPLGTSLTNYHNSYNAGYAYNHKRALSSAGHSIRLVSKKPLDCHGNNAMSLIQTRLGDDASSDELRFQIDKLCKIKFNARNGQNWSDYDESMYFNEDYFFNNATTRSILLNKTSNLTGSLSLNTTSNLNEELANNPNNSLNYISCNNKNNNNINNNNNSNSMNENNYILYENSDNRSEFNYASLDEDESNDLYTDNNLDEINEDEDKGFSDDELYDTTMMKEPAKTGGSRKQLSKVSLSRDASLDSNCESLRSSEDEDEDDLSDDLSESGESMNEILQKYGFEYKQLFQTISKRNENGELIQLKPPFNASQFEFVPPTINFVCSDYKLTDMPEKLSRLCRWKMCSITPNIVRSTVARSNFKLANHKYDWIGVWGSHMKPEAFKAIREYQKVNHFPGSFQIGRKDRLCKNLYHAQTVYGKSEYNFVPLTFVLPHDYLLFKTEMEARTNSKWILKPPASARGQGIRLVNKLDQVPKKRPCVVQKYLSNPYLIDNLKFDLRIYVYVTSYDPLRVYIFNDGLTRFASRKYSNSNKTIHDKFMHLTNYSINKANKEYKTNNDENACYGHKWSLKALWAYLKKKGINTDKIWDNICDLVVKTIICGDPHVNLGVKSNVRRKYSVHELFGFDVILDENLKPWIVEVNISPSLNSSSPLDVSVKGQMIADLFNLAGYMLPDPRQIARVEGKKHYIKVPKILLFNKSILPQPLSNDEKMKHNYYIQRHNDEKALSTLFDVITPDDLRILVETEDEYARRGNFQRIFPSPTSKNYMKFFEMPRYYNILITEWVDKFKRNQEKAISLLNYYCKKKVHLQNPAISIENQWTQHKAYKYLDSAGPIRSKSFVGFQNNDRELVA